MYSAGKRCGINRRKRLDVKGVIKDIMGPETGLEREK
jgi:hypothetical protein